MIKLCRLVLSENILRIVSMKSGLVFCIDYKTRQNKMETRGMLLAGKEHNLYLMSSKFTGFNRNFFPVGYLYWKAQLEFSLARQSSPTNRNRKIQQIVLDIGWAVMAEGL